MIIGLASPRVAATLYDGLDKIERLLAEASAQGAEIVCFPEAYLPGLRGQDFDVLPFEQTQQERVLQAVAQSAQAHKVATILGMERLTEAGRQIAAFVIDARGQIQGCQTKNQLDPTEDREGVRLTEWGSSGGPYYEKAMMMRSIENAIYFASVRRARAGHQGRGRNRFARHSIRTRALSRIPVGVSAR